MTVFNETGDPAFNEDPLMGRDFEDFSNLIGNPANPLDIAIFDPGSEIPSLWSFSIGVAHQLTPTVALEADYVHQRTENQFRSDSNLFFDEANRPPRPIADSTRIRVECASDISTRCGAVALTGRTTRASLPRLAGGGPARPS